MSQTLPDLLDFRLEIANKLVDAANLEKARLRRIEYQDSLISVLSSSPLELGNTTLPKVEVQTECIASFTILNEEIIKGVKDKKCLILESLSAYREIDRSGIETPYLTADIHPLLAQYHQTIADVKQLQLIQLTREACLETANLEIRVRALIRDSRILSSIAVSLINPRWTAESMESCRIALEHLLERARQLRGHSLHVGIKGYMEDPSLSSRLARVRSGLAQLRDTHSECARGIATTEEDISELSSSLFPPLMPTFQEEIESIEIKLKTLVVNFFEGDKKSILQRLGLTAYIDIHDLIPRIWTRLEKVINMEGYVLNLDLDDDSRNMLYGIWGCPDDVNVHAMTPAINSIAGTGTRNYTDVATVNGNLTP